MNEILKIYEKNEKYKYIKEIHLTRSLESYEGLLYDMELVLSQFPYEYDEVTILFEGIKDIRLSDLNNCLPIGIKIEDISNNQLEEINFKVEDVGEELFSFCCRNIVIID